MASAAVSLCVTLSVATLLTSDKLSKEPEVWFLVEIRSKTLKFVGYVLLGGLRDMQVCALAFLDEELTSAHLQSQSIPIYEDSSSEPGWFSLETEQLWGDFTAALQSLEGSL